MEDFGSGICETQRSKTSSPELCLDRVASIGIAGCESSMIEFRVIYALRGNRLVGTINLADMEDATVSINIPAGIVLGYELLAQSGSFMMSFVRY